MKINRITLLLSLILIPFYSSWAQQKIDPTLEVKRDFDVRLTEISKGKLLQNFHDSLGRFNLSFNYSIFDKPITNLFEFAPVSAASLEKGVAHRPPTLYVKGGVNYPLNPYGELFLSPHINNSFKITLSAFHNSFFSKLKIADLSNNKITTLSEQVNAPSDISSVSINPRFKWSKGEMGVNFEYQKSHNSFYGYGTPPDKLLGISAMRDSMGNNNSNAKISFFAHSVNPNHNTFKYNTQISYSSLESISNHIFDNTLFNNKITENKLSLLIEAGAGFANHNTIMAGASYQAATPLLSDTLSRSKLELFPRYIFKTGRWDFTLGFKYTQWWEKENTEYNIYFSGQAKFALLSQKLWVYALLDGTNNFMTYQELLSLNPWVNSNIQITNIEQPVIAKVGFSGKITPNINFNCWGGYEEYRNQLYLYSNPFLLSNDTPQNSFEAIYANQSRYGLGAEFSYYGSSFEGGVISKYYTFVNFGSLDGKHYNTPPFILNLYGRYNWRERILATLSMGYRDATPVLINLKEESGSSDNLEKRYTPATFTGDLSVTYNYNKSLSFGLSLNNLLNAKIFEFGSYSTLGFNGGLFASFKF